MKILSSYYTAPCSPWLTDGFDLLLSCNPGPLYEGTGFTKSPAFDEMLVSSTVVACGLGPCISVDIDDPMGAVGTMAG